MSHTLKLFLKIIHRRLYTKLENDISTTQFGFKQGLGTRETSYGINTLLIQRCLDVNRSIFACFIDFTKTFYNVQHDKLIKILKDKNIDSRDTRIISNLYWNQTTKIKVEVEFSVEIKIKKRSKTRLCFVSPIIQYTVKQFLKKRFSTNILVLN